jgi:hypothetical protein
MAEQVLPGSEEGRREKGGGREGERNGPVYAHVNKLIIIIIKER